MKNPEKRNQFVQDCIKCLNMSADTWLLSSVKDKLRNVNDLPFVEEPFDINRVRVAFDKYHKGEVDKVTFNNWCNFYGYFINKYANPTTRAHVAWEVISDILRNGCSKNSQDKLAEIEHHNAMLIGQIPADYELSSDWESYYTSVNEMVSATFWNGRYDFCDWANNCFHVEELYEMYDKYKSAEHNWDGDSLTACDAWDDFRYEVEGKLFDAFCRGELGQREASNGVAKLLVDDYTNYCFYDTPGDFLELHINRFKKAYHLFVRRDFLPCYYLNQDYDDLGTLTNASHVTRPVFNSLVSTVKLLGYTQEEYFD